MRLLFDEQLSEELVTLLANPFPGSLHVRSLGAGGAADPVVWLRAGNSTTGDIARPLRHRADDLRAFHAHGEATFLELG